MNSSNTCNLNCICINSDCSYKHYISYKERKIVKKFYDIIEDINKDENNLDTRKKNCTFGQLCDKETCGFRHRLSFRNREKLIVSYRFHKICPTKSEINLTKSDLKSVSTNNKTINSKNLFLSLDDDEEEIEIEDEDEEIKEKINKKSWVDVVSNTKKVNLNLEIKNWEDLDDDEFYMKF